MFNTSLYRRQVGLTKKLYFIESSYHLALNKRFKYKFLRKMNKETFFGRKLTWTRSYPIKLRDT